VTLTALAFLAASCGDSGKPGACGLGPGDLVITEIMADPEGANAGKEWFELYNATSGVVHLAGLTLEVVGTGGSKTHLVRGLDAPDVSPLEYVALGDGVAGLNDLAYSYGTDLGSLSNTTGTVIVRCGDAEVDRVEYGGTAGPGAPTTGRSLQLSGSVTPEYQANDDPASWCDATELMGDGVDYGTPGRANTPCP
jgi:hypothetical protein